MKLLGCCILAVALALGQGAPDIRLRAAIHKEEVEGDLKGAIEQYRKIVQSKDRAAAAKALVRIGQCYEKLGDAEARKAYEQAVHDYADQAEAAATARARLAAMGQQGRSLAEPGTQRIFNVGDRRFTSGISRDGHYSAFTFPGGVFLFDLKTSEVRRLVQRDGEETYWNALISPDGTQVAYSKSPTLADSLPILQLVGVDGSGPRSLAVGGEGRAAPRAWTPDGKRLLVVRFRKDAAPERVLVPISGGPQVVIGTGPISGARISPDGSVAAISEYGQQSNASSITLLSLRGAPPETIANASDPVWTPDGNRLLFMRHHDGSSDLMSIRIQGGKPVGAPDFVRQGVSRVLDFGPEGECYYLTTLLLRNLFTAGIDPQTGKPTGQPLQLTSKDMSHGAAWSPNGELLAYYKTGSSGMKGVVRSMKTGEEREVSLKEPLDFYSAKPQWFPDSRSLLVHSWDGAVRRVDIETAESQVLLASGSVPVYARVGNISYQTLVVLSPDGGAIYFAAHGPDANVSRILKRDLAGGAEREIARIDANNIRGLAVSPDGGRLAVYDWSPAGSRIQIVLMSTGAVKQVHTAGLGTDNRRLHDVMWSPDGRRLIFLEGYGKGQILSIPAEGGEPQSLGIDLHDIYYLNVRPDGKQIVFADEQWNNHLWVARNLFPPVKAQQ